MAEVTQPSIEEVQQMLVQFLTPNTQVIAQAVTWLVSYLKQPFSVPVMFQILTGSASPNIRQTAGVLLRSWLVKHWSSVDEDVVHVMKDQLLNIFATEPEFILRKTISDLITLIARITLPQEEWPQFWPAMFQLANSTEYTHRQAVLGVIEDLTDKIFDVMIPHMDDIIAFNEAALQVDQNPHVRVAAMKCTGVIMGEVQEENSPLVPKLKPLVPGMLEIIKYSVENGADSEAIDGFNILQAMVETCPAILSPHISPVIQYCMQISANHDLDWDIRTEGMTFIEWVIHYRPSFAIKQHLLDPILQLAFDVAAEPEADGFGYWGVTPHRFALQIIDCVSRFIKPKYTFDNLMSRVNTWMVSQNPWERRAAIGALSAMPNGCCEQMLPALPEYIPYIQAAFDDADQYVRQAGCILLGQFSEYLCPDILDHHAVCLPLIYRALSEDNEEIQERALYTFITFLENLDRDAVGERLDEVITRLVTILQSSSNKDIQDMAISAISALASACLEAFLPYWEGIVKMLQQLMDVTDPELLPLRCRALDAVGVISMAVGKEAFGSQYFDFFMHKALEGFSLVGNEATELREYAINFFANVAEALGQDFLPYLETCLELVLTSLQNVEGSKPEMSEDQLHMARLLLDHNDEDEDTHGDVTSDPENDEDRLPPELAGMDYVVNQGLISEKTNALQALGTFALAIGPAFIPYIDRCIPVVQQVGRFVHPKVRSFAIYPLESFLTCLHQAYPSPNPWTPGADPEAHPLNQDVQNYADALLSLYTKRMLVDFDLGVLARYLESLKFILTTVGAPAINHHMNAFGAVIQKVLHMQTAAQVMETDQGDVDNEELEQELLAVFDGACDFLSALAKAYGSKFPMFFALLEGVIHHLSAGSEEELENTGTWRQDGIGCLAEVVDAVGIQHFPDDQVRVLLAQAHKALLDPYLSARCNGIYLTRLISPSPETFAYWPKLLEILVPFINDEDDQIADNTLGALSTMIATNPSLLPMAEMVPEWLSGFPLRTDQIESTICYTTLLQMISNSSQDIFPHIPTAFTILIDALGSPVITDDIRAQCVAAVKQIWTQFSAELEPLTHTLDEDQTNNLQQVLH